MHLGPHSHDHACSHGDAPVNLNLPFALAVGLNILLVVGEAIGGFLSGSVALLADAGHNLGDVAGLVLAWWAHWLRSKPADGRWTYGLRAFTILASTINGLLLVVTILGVGFESFRRLLEPAEVAEVPVLLVAFAAAIINFGTAKLLSGKDDDLNIRGAYLHMLADAAVSMAVVVGAVLIMITNQHWIDPAISIAICIVLGFGTWGLLKESASMLMHAAPRRVELEEVRAFLLSNPEIETITDLHVWSVSTTEVLMTVRIVCPEMNLEHIDEFLEDLHEQLQARFQIAHATLEIRRQLSDSSSCNLEA